MNDPDLVLFDEPTSALDTQLGDQVEADPQEMKARGIAAIVVTHDERMTHYCDRIVHIVDGVGSVLSRNTDGRLAVERA